VEHLVERRTRDFAASFAGLPADRRTPAEAMRVLYDQCFRSTYESWLELAVAARCDPALHERFAQFDARFFEDALATFCGLFPDAAANPSFARVALRLTFALLEGLATSRLTGVADDEIEAVIEAFNAIAAPYFPQNFGGSS